MVKSPPRRRPYRSAYGVARLRTRSSLESTGRSSGGFGKFTAWTAGILASCLVATAGFWINKNGEDTVAELRSEPPLKSLVTIKDPSTLEVALDRGPLSGEDFAKLRIASDPENFLDLINSYGSARMKYLHAQIVLIGGRNELTVINIAVRHRTRRAEPLTGGYIIRRGQGGEAIPSEQIRVNLDSQESSFEIKDKPGVRYFDTKTVVLKRDESIAFEVDFLAPTGYHEFDLEATYSLGGKEEKTIIAGPDNGVFKVSGAADDYRTYRGELYTVSPTGVERIPIDEICSRFPKSKGCQ